MQRAMPSLLLLVLIAAVAPSGSAQSNPRLQAFFEQNVGLSQDQIYDIRSGIPVVKILPARTPAEVFLFGAVYIHAAPESYLKLATDFDRLRKLSGYLALEVFGNPPQLADLNGLSLAPDDIRTCRSVIPVTA